MFENQSKALLDIFCSISQKETANEIVFMKTSVVSVTALSKVSSPTYFLCHINTSQSLNQSSLGLITSTVASFSHT